MLVIFQLYSNFYFQASRKLLSEKKTSILRSILAYLRYGFTCWIQRYLHSEFNIDKQKVSMNPLRMFLRLVSSIKKMTEPEMKRLFEYEIIPCPTPLLEYQVMTHANI